MVIVQKGENYSIQFESSNNGQFTLFESIRFKMKNHSHSTILF